MIESCGLARGRRTFAGDRQVTEQGRGWRVGREGTSVLTVVHADGTSLLDEVVREGARRMLAAALEAEVNAYLAELADQRDDNGRRLVVGIGHQPRKVITTAGVVEVKAPRVHDKRVVTLVGSAQQRWRAVDAAPLVPLVRAGARFERGRLTERPEGLAA
jgi:hypothetical protein